ncbi:MAG: hypothetical protein IIB36_04285 [Gemmatimonadetes bacterium]|nr:hypothetical protein [Gemmatimonadota bacterium]
MKRFKYLTLVALVAVAACDEGVDPIVPPVTGTIAGVVTIEAVAAVGVAVTLSSGPTATTDAAGAYQFDGVPVGSYTVTISGFASDATFTATLKAATISSSGQVVTANFDGSYVRTSAIIGAVSVGSAPLAGVSIAIGGMSSAATATDQLGQYSFSGLRAGSYTVEMTNPSTASYIFGSTSASVTLATGASEVVTFEGSLVTTASISGALFIDEFSKDSVLNTGLEENLTIAGVPISLEGILVLDTMTVLTDATGSFTFPDLAEGSYHITIGSLANVPGMVAFSGMTQLTTTVGPGEHGTANFPFSIITQTINVGAFLGTDLDVASKPGPAISPIKSWSIRLFDTQAHAAAYVATGATAGKLTSKAVKTNSAGMSTFRFARSKDLSPDSSKVDHLVFAASRGAPSGTYAENGETIIEIQYPTTDSSTTAVDEFDALYNALTIAFNAEEIDGDALPGWQTVLRANKDTLVGPVMSGATDAVGWSYFDLTVANLAATTNGALPDTLWMRLSTTQAAANGHGFIQTATDREGSVKGGQVRFIWDGTNLPNDTIWVGTQRVKYTDVDVLFGIHQEQDDSTDVATFTKGDGTTGVSVLRFQLYNISSKGKATTFGGSLAPGPGAPFKAWERPYFNITVDTAATTGGGRLDMLYRIRATSTDPRVDILNDTLVDFTLDGGDQVDTIAPLRGSGGVSTFATKANNTSISGTILSVDGVTPIDKKTLVTIQATSDNIQPNKRGTDSILVKTATDGTWALTGMREGPYTVSVEDDTGKWEYMVTLQDTTQKANTGAKTVPVAGKVGSEDENTDAHTATRDNQGWGGTSVVNFAPHYMATKIEGLVVNDRDSDFNTVDAAEALAGVVITLTDDADADGKIDSGETQVTTTTDADGAYSFTGLKEDNYIISADPNGLAGVTVLRSLDSSGDPLAKTSMLTTAAKGAGATKNQTATRQVGNTDPLAQLDELPRWDYALNVAADDLGNNGAGPNSVNAASTITPTHFLHLFANGTLTGSVVDGDGDGQVVTVFLRQCATAVGFPVGPTPPFAGTCTTTWADAKFSRQVNTDASGNYTFISLPEGVYDVTTSGAETSPAGGFFLVRLRGDQDQAIVNFIIS